MGWATMHFQLQLPVHGTLPSFVRDKQSLAAFRHQLKTVLFRTSLARMLIPELRHCQHVTVVLVRWPCNVCAWQCHFKHQRL